MIGIVNGALQNGDHHVVRYILGQRVYDLRVGLLADQVIKACGELANMLDLALVLVALPFSDLQGAVHVTDRKGWHGLFLLVQFLAAAQADGVLFERIDDIAGGEVDRSAGVGLDIGVIARRVDGGGNFLWHDFCSLQMKIFGRRGEMRHLRDYIQMLEEKDQLSEVVLLVSGLVVIGVVGSPEKLGELAQKAFGESKGDMTNLLGRPPKENFAAKEDYFWIFGVEFVPRLHMDHMMIRFDAVDGFGIKA